MTKKTFTVEIEFNETKGSGNVIYDYSLENMLEVWLDGFIETNSIEKEYYLKVNELVKQEE